jgi:hypothetical protein
MRDATGARTLEIELPFLPERVPSWASHVWIPGSYSDEQLQVVLDLLRPLRLDRLSIERPLLDALDATQLDFTALASFSLINDLYVKGATEGVRPADLSPLSALGQLQKLTLWCRFDQVEALSSLTDLRLLGLCSSEGGRREPLDLTPLGGLRRLERLVIHDDLVHLEAVAALPELRELSLNFSNVGDLSPLRSARRLESLSLDHTQVRDLQPLAGLSELRELSLEGTAVTDLRPLEQCPNLERLALGHSRVLDLSPLARCARLVQLDLGGCEVKTSRPSPARRLSAPCLSRRPPSTSPSIGAHDSSTATIRSRSSGLALHRFRRPSSQL